MRRSRAQTFRRFNVAPVMAPMMPSQQVPPSNESFELFLIAEAAA